MVRHEEPIREITTDGMHNHAFSEKAPYPFTRGAVIFVFSQVADALHAPDANDDSPSGILDQRHLLGIEKDERFLRANVIPKAVEKRAMVAVVLKPVGFKPQHVLGGLVAFADILKRKLLDEAGDIFLPIAEHEFLHHPAERESGGAISWVMKWRGLEMSMCLLAGVGIGMRVHAREAEVGHKGRALLYARRKLLRLDVLDRFSCNGRFSELFLVLKNVFQLEARGVAPRELTHSAVPPGVVPRHANRNMPERKRGLHAVTSLSKSSISPSSFLMSVAMVSSGRGGS